MAGGIVVSETYDPESGSARRARQFVVRELDRMGFGELAESGALCATELAANAILHARTPFTVSVEPAGTGVVVSALDPVPDLLPIPIPASGSATEITRRGTTGRGLQLVGAVAARWGVTADRYSKTVWVELHPDRRPGPPREPVLDVDPPPPPPDAMVLRFLDLPVRTAIASGLQLDEVIRELQVRDDPPDHLGALFTLLDRSASVRLAGRYAAMRAAAADQLRFDLELVTTADALVATGHLGRVLEAMPPAAPGQPSVSEDVAQFRRWLVEETRRQRGGEAPARCPLPDG